MHYSAHLHSLVPNKQTASRQTSPFTLALSDGSKSYLDAGRVQYCQIERAVAAAPPWHVRRGLVASFRRGCSTDPVSPPPAGRVSEHLASAAAAAAVQLCVISIAIHKRRPDTDSRPTARPRGFSGVIDRAPTTRSPARPAARRRVRPSRTPGHRFDSDVGGRPARHVAYERSTITTSPAGSFTLNSNDVLPPRCRHRQPRHRSNRLPPLLNRRFLSYSFCSYF